jgi:hypothetical protein
VYVNRHISSYVYLYMTKTGHTGTKDEWCLQRQQKGTVHENMWNII